MTASSRELPLVLMQALRRFGPSWVRFLRGHLNDPRVSPERLQLLGALAQAGEPLIMRQITTQLGTTPRAVTALVDGLERDGLVVRLPHPSDRRAVLVELAPSGRSLLSEAGRGFAEAARLFDVLDEEEQRVLLGLLGQLTDRLADLLCDSPSMGCEAEQDVTRPVPRSVVRGTNPA
ncbi:MAG: MarR family transcriptional regulator [Actinomycetota bacterium]|nr:MarR family transcriptional regulator [Actinomycetota bacterium]